MYLYQADASVLLVDLDGLDRLKTFSRDMTLGVSSRGQLTELQVREAMGEKLCEKFGSSMKEWRIRGGIASIEDEADITVILILRGAHPSNVVGDAPHPASRY